MGKTNSLRAVSKVSLSHQQLQSNSPPPLPLPTPTSLAAESADVASVIVVAATLVGAAQVRAGCSIDHRRGVSVDPDELQPSPSISVPFF